MKTCCLTGHREMPKNINIAIKNLYMEIDNLIKCGVDTFLSGARLTDPIFAR